MTRVSDGASLGVTLGLLVVAWAIGVGILRGAGLRVDGNVESAVTGIGVGLWVLSYVPFVLSALHALTPIGIRIASLVASFSGLVLISKRPISIDSSVTRSSEYDTTPRWLALVAIGGIALAIAVLFVSFTPLADYDGLTYHVAAPVRWMELGSLRCLPTQLQTQWPMGSEMLYTLLLPVGGVGACKCLVALFAILTALAAYALGERLAGPAAGTVAGACCLRGLLPNGVNTTSVEPALAFAVTLSALAIVRWREVDQAGERRTWLLVGAAMAGFVCYIKLSGIIPMLVLTGVVIACPASVKPGPMYRRVLTGASFAGIALACALSWYGRTWVNTGNPIYPFAYGLLGGRDWNQHAADVLGDYLRYFDVPGATLAARQAFVLHEIMKMAIVTAAAIAVPLSRSIRPLIAAAGLFAIVQAAASDQYRFLLPAAPFAAVALGVWVWRVSANRPYVGWLCAVLILAINVRAAFGVVGSSYRSVFGMTSSQTEPYAANTWINSHLPKDAHILSGPDTRVYRLQREVWLTDEITQQEIPLTTTSAFTDALRRHRIDYFVFNRAIFNNATLNFEVKLGWRTKERARLLELAARSEPIAAFGAVTVYRIGPN